MQVDAVVLDVDGVLVDVHDSYRRAVVESVERVHGRTLPRSALQAFKDAGGFNNDWDLTYAVALYVLATGEGYRASPKAFADAIADRGGGLEAAREVVVDAIGARAAQRVTDRWDRERLYETFQALYLGESLYRALEEAEPPFEVPGFIHDEPVLIEADTIAVMRERWALGVLTGRPAAEAAIALDRAGLTVPEPCRMTMDDWDGSKPDPEGLCTLAERLEAERVAFIGDTLDDVRTAVRAQERDPDRTYAGIGVLTGGLTGESGRDAFREAGAALVLEDVNEAVNALEGVAR